MPLPEIPEPDNTSLVPDKATKKGMSDQTASDHADGRIMVLNLGFFKYGTDNRGQAAALVLSIALLGFLAVMLAASDDSERNREVITWLQTTLLLTLGVAIGQSFSTDSRNE